MTFSIDFVIAEENDYWAADWDSNKGEWTLSCKERFSSSQVWHCGGDIKISRYGILAYQSILSKFGLPHGKYDLGDIINMSPKQLAELGTMDPISDAAGDGRMASEVDY